MQRRKLRHNFVPQQQTCAVCWRPSPPHCCCTAATPNNKKLELTAATKSVHSSSSGSNYYNRLVRVEELKANRRMSWQAEPRMRGREREKREMAKGRGRCGEGRAGWQTSAVLAPLARCRQALQAVTMSQSPCGFCCLCCAAGAASALTARCQPFCNCSGQNMRATFGQFRTWLAWFAKDPIAVH